MTAGSYTAGLKEILTGSPTTPLVWLCNFEVEREWARGHVGLPGGGSSQDPGPTVQRMEELGLLLAEPEDHVLLGQPVDDGFRAHLEGLGFELGREIVIAGAAAAGGTARGVLDDADARRRLGTLAAEGYHMLPMGTSADEQKVGEAAGLPPAAAACDTAAQVNSKIYSRRLVEHTGLRPIPGACCEDVDDLREALTPAPNADAPVIVKDAFGVSGRGLLVLDDPRRADGLLRMVTRRAERSGDRSMEVVVESFLDKSHDLNYQFTLGRDGQMRFDFVKRAQTANGVHQGHVIPPGLGEQVEREIRDAAEVIAARLHADGYFGVVGVDALIDTRGNLYPVVEINARLNMSTYQGRVLERFAPAGHALARHYPLRLTRPVSFEEIQDALGGLLDPTRPGGAVVPMCFGTVNAEAGHGAPFDGRLYAVVVGADNDTVQRADALAIDALRHLRATEEM